MANIAHEIECSKGLAVGAPSLKLPDCVKTVSTCGRPGADDFSISAKSHKEAGEVGKVVHFFFKSSRKELLCLCLLVLDCSQAICLVRYSLFSQSVFLLVI